ncbi:MAG: hypothetical protein H0T42_30820 [Deltaproteobacteria bacterium]|nr:hypothetical protein [Deltaproteobacteria bacterium]
MRPEHRPQHRVQLAPTVASLIKEGGTDSLRKILVDDQRILTNEEFDSYVQLADKVNASGLIKITMMALVWSNRLSRIERLGHYQMLRRANGLPPGNDATIARDTIAEMIALKRYPDRWADVCDVREAPKGKRLGETLIAIGAASSEDVDQALALQRELQRTCGANLKLGVTMLFMGMISFGEYIQGLVIQHGVPFENLDQATDAAMKLEL